MKKWIAVLVAVLMTVSAMGVFAETTTGGWTMFSTMYDFNEEASVNAYAAFEKAVETWEGTDMIIAQPLSMQVVAGINYCYLVQTFEDAESEEFSWGIAVVYEDLSGDASVSYVYPIGKDCAGEEGGWSNVGEINEESFDGIWDALYSVEDPTVVPYSYIVLNQQVVAGMNYELLCQYALIEAEEETEEDADTEESEEEELMPEPIAEGFALAVVYIDLDNNASLIDFQPIEIPQQ